MKKSTQTAEKVQWGVLMCRFQTYILTEAHMALVQYALSRADRVLLVLGVSPYGRTTRDPLTFEERKELVRNTFSDEELRRIVIVPMQDIPESDERWVTQFEGIIGAQCLENGELPLSNVLLFGGRDSFLRVYHANGGVHAYVSVPEVPGVSATALRERLVAGYEGIDDYADDFARFSPYSLYLAGIIRPIVAGEVVSVHRVTVVPFSNDGTRVVMCQLPNGLWQFPTKQLCGDAPRDLRLEASLVLCTHIGTEFTVDGIEAGAFVPVSTPSHMGTNLYVVQQMWGEPIVGVFSSGKYVAVDWFAPENIAEEMIVTEQRELFRVVIRELFKQKTKATTNG